MQIHGSGLTFVCDRHLTDRPGRRSCREMPQPNPIALRKIPTQNRSRERFELIVNVTTELLRRVGIDELTTGSIAKQVMADFGTLPWKESVGATVDVVINAYREEPGYLELLRADPIDPRVCCHHRRVQPSRRRHLRGTPCDQRDDTRRTFAVGHPSGGVGSQRGTGLGAHRKRPCNIGKNRRRNEEAPDQLSILIYGSPIALPDHATAYALSERQFSETSSLFYLLMLQGRQLEGGAS